MKWFCSHRHRSAFENGDCQTGCSTRGATQISSCTCYYQEIWFHSRFDAVFYLSMCHFMFWLPARKSVVSIWVANLNRWATDSCGTNCSNMWSERSKWLRRWSTISWRRGLFVSAGNLYGFTVAFRVEHFKHVGKAMKNDSFEIM